MFSDGDFAPSGNRDPVDEATYREMEAANTAVMLEERKQEVAEQVMSGVVKGVHEDEGNDVAATWDALDADGRDFILDFAHKDDAERLGLGLKTYKLILRGLLLAAGTSRTDYRDTFMRRRMLVFKMEDREGFEVVWIDREAGDEGVAGGAVPVTALMQLAAALREERRNVKDAAAMKELNWMTPSRCGAGMFTPALVAASAVSISA